MRVWAIGLYPCFATLTGNAPVSVLVSLPFPEFTSQSTADARYWGARWGAATDHLKRSVPSSSATVADRPEHYQPTGKGMPITMPGLPSIRLSSVVKNQPRDPCSAFTLRT